MSRTLLLIILIGLTYGQQLQIFPVNNDNGYLISKINEKSIIQSYTKILHIINLTTFEALIDAFTKNINNFEFDENSNDLIFLTREINNLKKHLIRLIPRISKRNKRGLLNVVGTGFKYIIGTMDSNDAEEIYSHLKNLEQNTRQLTDETNSQVMINNNLIKGLNDVTEHFNEQQTLLTDKFNEFLVKINQGLLNMERHQNVLQLYANIMTIDRHFEKIEDIILLSKLNVFAHDILTDEEINKYNLSIEAFPYIKNSVLFKDHLIVFAILIPKFTTEKYFHSIIIPCPNLENYELNIDSTEIIIQGNHIFENTQEYITKQKLRIHQNKCIRNLLQTNNSCPYRFNSEENIELIKENIIITKKLPLTNLTQDCIDQNFPIKGTNIILFNNCKIKIENTEYSNKIETFKDSLIFPTVNLNKNKLINNVTLKELHGSTIENRKIINYLEQSHKNNLYITFVIICIIIVLIIVSITICFFKYKKLRNKKSKNNVNLKVAIEQPYVKNEMKNTGKLQNITPF